MKLLAVRMARSIWLVPTYFFNPRGIFTRPMIEAMKVRYSFLKTPLDNPFPKPEEGYKYENGAFNGKNGSVIITSMTIHNDGIVVDTRSSTDDGDAFLEDAITWGNKEFGLQPYAALPINKIYASELNVVFENAPLILNPKLSKFINDVSSAFVGLGKGNVDFLGFQLTTDTSVSDKTAPAVFRFEREISTAHSENRYYSLAPTTTDEHIKLLEKLEKLTT
jgi:hypothetical protein